MRTSTAFLAWLAIPFAAVAQDAPLSAIDWLSDSVAETAVPAEPPVTSSALPRPIIVTPLDRSAPDAIGLVDAAELGLPRTLWFASTTDTLTRQFAEMRPPRSATMQRLLHDLLRVRAVPPNDSAGNQAFFLARIDALLASARFATARKMMAQAGSERPAIFRRWFDVTLLTGAETRACRRMRTLPEITPTYPARIFCLARTGDWPAAIVTLETARALGVVTPAETERLTRFLDDHAGAGLLPPPARPNPLDFHLYEAMGEPLRTPALPLPFAHADLRGNTGWKARVEAAERLARAGAITADRLWEIYAERDPAASGELWERVARVQELEAALHDGDPADVSEALPPAWSALSDADLIPTLVQRHAATFSQLPLEKPAADLARRAAALAGQPLQGAEDALAQLSRGIVPPSDPTDPLMLALVAGLSEPPPGAAADLISDDRLGEALLHAIRLIEAGAGGNLDALSDGLAILRAAGQAPYAFDVAIEALVTGWRG